MKNKLILLTALVALVAPIALSALTGEEIVRRADDLQTFRTSEASGEMRIKDRFGTKVTTFKSWSRGASDSLIEFTSIAERGQKILRTEDTLYLYYPDAEELIPMKGSSLRQSLMGSDVSYEDMAGDKDRISKYDIELIGEESVNGHRCYVLMMTAKVRTVPYPKEKVWIDKESFIGWKAEYYTRSGRLLKEVEILKTEEIGGRMVAIETRVSDKMKTDTETLMILNDLKIDIPLDDNLFSLDELTW